MTSHGVMALILRYFTEFGSFGAHNVKVVENRPMLSVMSECILHVYDIRDIVLQETCAGLYCEMV